MSLLAPFFLCLLLTLTLQGLGFAHAFRFQTEKFYDLVGGANSLLILLLLGLLSAGKDSSGAGFGLRKWLLALAFAGSRGWLLALLVSRRKQREGDARFAEFRAHFWQFGVVWLLQAGWVFCVALPVIVVLGAETNEGLGLTDLLLFALLYGAVFAQVLADLQKQNWIQAGRPGGFCNVGLWFLSRHPNYCAEMVFWWCAWAVCSALWSLFDVEHAFFVLLALLSPLTTMVLLLFVSGLPLAEGPAGLQRYDGVPGYSEYRAATPILCPVPKSLWKLCPEPVQRYCCCEFRRYRRFPPEAGTPGDRTTGDGGARAAGPGGLLGFGDGAGGAAGPEGGGSSSSWLQTVEAPIRALQALPVAAIGTEEGGGDRVHASGAGARLL